MSIASTIKDHQQTIANVRDFFRKGKAYDSYLAIATACSDIHSVNLQAPAVDKPQYTDGIEKMLIKGMNAQKIVTSVKEAITLIPNEDAKTAIKESCLDHKVGFQICNQIHVSHTQLANLKSYGFYFFADLFLMRQIANNVDDPINLKASPDVL